MRLRVELSPAETREQFRAAAGQILFKGGATPVDSSVTAHVELA